MAPTYTLFAMKIHPLFKQYFYLTRLNKPIGLLLLLWPTLWALYLANHGQVALKNLFIFIVGVVLMRSAGCVVNDFADRKVDGFVERTKHRPLVTGAVSSSQALGLAAVLLGLAFILVLFCSPLTIGLAFIGAGLAIIYPFLKRITYLPQFGLGLAFSWGVPMAFAAEINTIPAKAWFLYAVAMIWPVIYDTMYAMVDREDDKKIGIKSTAILFAAYDKFIIALLQIIFILALVSVGYLFDLKAPYYVSLFIAALLFVYQQYLISARERAACFQAFLNNNWLGLVVFLGILLGIQ